MTISRTSHEVRGLKSLKGTLMYLGAESHLTRGAWIEIAATNTGDYSAASRTSHEVRGLKLCNRSSMYSKKLSHLTRGAWIEILVRSEGLSGKRVAPHTRCVD